MTMQEPSSNNLTDLRERWRALHRRVDDTMTAHARAAMRETGGKVKRAAKIFLERITADVDLKRDLDALHLLSAQRWPSLPSDGPCLVSDSAVANKPSDSRRENKKHKRKRKR
jgi:hypothetical protein